MSYFDEVLSKTRSVAEIVGKKSAEALEVSKKKIELIDCKNKLTKAYAVLGKIQYESSLGIEISESAVESAVNEIQRHYEKAELLELEIKAILETQLCPNCGSEIKNDSAFCSKCGAEL